MGSYHKDVKTALEELCSWLKKVDNERDPKEKQKLMRNLRVKRISGYTPAVLMNLYS